MSGNSETRSVWLPVPAAEPVPVWSGGTVWERMSSGDKGCFPALYFAGERRFHVIDNGGRWSVVRVGALVGRGVEAFARFLSTPVTGWRDWHPDRPPREGEPLLWLDAHGSVYSGDPFGVCYDPTCEEEDCTGCDDDDGRTPLEWWRSLGVLGDRWRYLAEILPGGGS